jgi:hypothetical protein
MTCGLLARWHEDDKKAAQRKLGGFFYAFQFLIGFKPLRT